MVQRALKSRQGRIRAGGVERNVAFEEPGLEVDADVDAAYHAKYDRYGPRMVGTVVSPEAARSTIRLIPRVLSERGARGMAPRGE